MSTNNKVLTLGSLFDGSGGFPLGGTLAGIRPVWSSEIEPFPIAVTRKRFPNVKHYGDVSKINGDEVEPVDIITFGSPCQDLSIVGKRKGLVDGDRSSLFFQAIRIIKEMRHATNGLDNGYTSPRFIVWENVFGAFSSNKGEDFKKVLEEVCKVKDESVSIPRPKKWNGAGCIMADGYSVAWRLFDAQYWGVPQRRRRIYLVADFDGQCAGDILFKSEGLSRNSTESRKPWERTSKNPKVCIGATGFDGYNGCLTGEVASTLCVNCGMSAGRNGVIQEFVFDNHSQDSRYTGPLDKANAVTHQYGTGGNNQPLVVVSTPKTLKIRCGCEGGGKGALIQDSISATLGTNNDQTLFQPIAFGICSKESNSMKSDNPNSGFYKADTSRTLDLNGANPSCNQGGIAVVENNCKETPNDVSYGIERTAFNQGKNAKFDFSIEEELSPTIISKGPNAVALSKIHFTLSYADGSKGVHSQMLNNSEENFVLNPPYDFDPVSSRDLGVYFHKDLGNTIYNGNCPGAHNGVLEHSTTEYYIVRRLTPTECARLQGFYDWWCDDISIPNPTEEDMEFWRNVFETHRKIVSSTSRPKSDRQINKWLANPRSDSSEYKMWGNGVALPNVYFVLSGIAKAVKAEQGGNHNGEKKESTTETA